MTNKKNIKRCLLTALILGFFFCANISKLYADCFRVLSFKENYINSFNKDNVLFIKGVALDVVEYGGRKIKVIGDLKGNFEGDSTILVWGGGDPPNGCITIERWDDLTKYKENDTLIMLIYTVDYEACFEKPGDYTTVTCSSSVLKESNGFLTGYVDSWPWVETVITWEELQDLLTTSNHYFNQKKYNIYQKDGSIFFDNPRNEVVKLSFYDLSGRLVHEATTTSDNYRPNLTRSFFICRIKIKNELFIIKYFQ